MPPPELETQADDEKTANTPAVETLSSQYFPQSSSPQHTLQHGECSPQLGTADLHGEDAGADDPVADSNKYPG